MIEYLDIDEHYKECDEQEDGDDLCICSMIKQDRQDEEDNNAVDEAMGN